MDKYFYKKIMPIACLVSGGVDSSVALKLLADEGQSITAFYLKIWLEDETAFLGECPWEKDLEYARAVCKKLKVPLEIIPFQREYYDRVIAYTLSEVRLGRTPNPDVMCNSFIKFGAFLEWLDTQERKFDKVATGHYACLRQVTGDGKRIRENESIKDEMQDTRYELLVAKDPVKDQTYFLSWLTQEQLSRACFPVGVYTKQEVRKMAKEWDLPTKDRPDSQGLCFLGKIDYNDFVRHHLGEKEGDIVDAQTNQVLGQHKGYWFYTVGQRHGLDLSGGPWYVTGKDIERNIVYISHRLKMTRIERDIFEVSNFRFLSGNLSFPRRRKPSAMKFSEKKSWIPCLPTGRPTFARMTGEEDAEEKRKNIFIKIRHGEKRYPCSVEFLNDKKTYLRVKLLEDKERGIASGQFAVLYDGEVCVGSGIIYE